MTNLYTETVECLNNYGRQESEVLWVGNNDVWCSWDKFVEIAKNTEYDSGYGGTEVATDLLIVGNDFWLERHEYDGSEWWEYKTMPVKPEKEFVPTTFISHDGVIDNFLKEG